MDPSPTPSRSPDPIDKVVFRSQSLRLALGFAAVGWTLAVAGPLVAFHLAKPDLGLAVVDPAGTWHFSRLNDFWTSQTVYDEAAKNVCLALLSRNPGGPDDPQLWTAIFTESGRKKAKKLFADTAGTFRDNAIFQSVKCGKIQVVQEPSQDGKRISRAVAWCQILQNGTMNGAAFTEPFTLKVSITLVANDDFLTNGMFPLVANDFTLERIP
ncbi:MAG: hypothetical protein PW734_11055 [Verrucomicrobium sp.]|nr:hypothetical protein [Verrucomicrobium sp.]